jgi:hypothetical protein
MAQGKTDRFGWRDVADAIREAKGLQVYAARILNCSVQTIVRYRKKFPQVDQAFQEANRAVGDLAENRLFRAIKKGEPWAITLYLRLKCRDRGYVEKTEIEHSGEMRVAGRSVDDVRKEMVDRMQKITTTLRN